MRKDAIAAVPGTDTGGGIPRRGFIPRTGLRLDVPDEPLAIADMADFFGVTHRTLHFYEEKGLISAGRSGPMRTYGIEDIERMAVINACREIGISIAVIQEMMEEVDGAASQVEADKIFRSVLTRRKRELTADTSHIRRQVQQIQTMLLNEAEEDRPAPSGNESPALTELENQCLLFMAEGYSAPRLARTLDVDADELLALESAIIRKLDATNRFQAVAKALLLGMIPD
ncbi:MerR family transcriptional regulator [Rhizobium deserti]|uniref:MerR family transcriptional regulator n=1 Tax=Rhizobium deserti TaxID=2547961 RepID=A0A4R5UIY0_9HYPH|nr:MerR family transcriptional regulator [Rhizobium deserti]TDK36798.1 MerR family transcriptional regulator [Rhizobium deserti]